MLPVWIPVLIGVPALKWNMRLVTAGEEIELSAIDQYRDTLQSWREKMTDHLRERGEGFVRNNELAIRKETMLYGPNYPEDERTKQEIINDWKALYKGLD